MGHAKMACGDKKAAAFCAILDPSLTLTQPSSVTALTGVDAISHAVETLVTTRRTPVSMMFSRQSFQWLAQSFHRVISEPKIWKREDVCNLRRAWPDWRSRIRCWERLTH